MRCFLFLLLLCLIVACGEDEQPTAPIVPDPADKIAPTVSIQAPQNGATVPKAFYFIANASDASGVHHVDFFANNKKLGFDTRAPYEIYVVTQPTQQYYFDFTLKAVATDNAGNVGTAAITIKSRGGF